MPTIKKQEKESRETADRRESKSLSEKGKDRNAPIRAVEKQLITAENHAL